MFVYYIRPNIHHNTPTMDISITSTKAKAINMKMTIWEILIHLGFGNNKYIKYPLQQPLLQFKTSDAVRLYIANFTIFNVVFSNTRFSKFICACFTMIIPALKQFSLIKQALPGSSLNKQDTRMYQIFAVIETCVIFQSYLTAVDMEL